MLQVWHDSCWGLAVTRLSQVRHCNLGTMCRVCVTEKLIFIKRETNSPEVQLERLHQEGKDSSEANLFACMWLHVRTLKTVQEQNKSNNRLTEKPTTNRKRSHISKEKSAVTSLTAEQKCALHHMADLGDNLPLCSGA